MNQQKGFLSGKHKRPWWVSRGTVLFLKWKLFRRVAEDREAGISLPCVLARA